MDLNITVHDPFDGVYVTPNNVINPTNQTLEEANLDLWHASYQRFITSFAGKGILILLVTLAVVLLVSNILCSYV